MFSCTPIQSRMQFNERSLPRGRSSWTGLPMANCRPIPLILCSTLPHEFLAGDEGLRVFAALQRIGWCHDRTVGSHKIMKKDGWPDYPFSFHDSEELGPAILAKTSKKDRPSTPVFTPG